MFACSICIEPFEYNDCLNATPCGHMFHSVCLNRWVNEAGTCPDCRRRLKINDLIPLYSSVNKSNKESMDPNDRKVIMDLKNKLSEKNQSLAEQTVKVNELKNRVIRLEESAANAKMELKETRLRESRSNKQNKVFQKQIRNLEDKNKSLEEQITFMNDIKTVVNAGQKEANQILEKVARQPILDEHDNPISLATMCSVLKQELLRVKKDNDKMRDQITEIKKGRNCRSCENKKNQSVPGRVLRSTAIPKSIPSCGEVKMDVFDEFESNRSSSSLFSKPISTEYNEKSKPKLKIIRYNKNGKRERIPVRNDSTKVPKYPFPIIATPISNKESDTMDFTDVSV